jgi:hypothetical protein
MAKLKHFKLWQTMFAIACLLAVWTMPNELQAQSKEYTDADVAAFDPRVRYYEASEANQMAVDIVNALDGDVFVLTTSGGLYELNYWTNVTAKVTVMADEDLVEKPIITNLKESNTTQILRFSGDGAGIHAKGVVFDTKSRAPGEYPLKYAIRTNPNIGNYSLVLEDCEFRGTYSSDDGSAGCAINLYEGTFADSIIIKDCIFDGDRGIVYSSSNGVYTWGKFEISNSTFMNMPDDDAIRVTQFGANKTLPVTIDHCTFYNVGGVNTDVIRLDSLYNVSVTNSIFGTSTADTTFLVYGDDANKGIVDYSVFFESPVPEADETKGGTVGTNIWTDDPQFADPVNGDLTLGNLTMYTQGSDGLPLGDLRWADIFAPVVLSEMAARSDSSLLLKYDEWIDTTSATTAANYALSGSAGYTGNVKKVELVNFRTVLLTLERFGAQVGNEIIVTVSNVEDQKGNAVAAPANVAKYTVEEFRPVVTADAQTVTNAADQVVFAQSNQGEGTLYVILNGEAQSTVAELDAAVIAMKGAKASVTTSYTDIEISVSGLEPGDYYAYASNAAGNLSEKGENKIVITDGISPIITMDLQSADNGADDFIVAQSNEIGKIYIVKDGEAQATVNDFVSARYSKKGAEKAVDIPDTNVQVPTMDLVPGVYYAYAVDVAGNISTRSVNPLDITQSTVGVSMATIGQALVYASKKRIVIQSDEDLACRVIIFDVLGRKIVNEELQSSTTSYDVAQSGLYFVTLQGDEGAMSTTKVLVK